MKRLTTTGCSLLSPALSEDKLKSALDRLGAAHAFDDAAVHELHSRISAINGAWIAKKESKEASSVAAALRVTGENLKDAARILSGHETGFQTTSAIHATTLAIEFLALDPTLDKDPRELIRMFCKDAVRIGQACLAANADLSQERGRDGRDALVWYNDFTAILLAIAQKANVDPTLGKDSVKDIPCGWLFEAAQELEKFLDCKMRSPSQIACGKRLERSKKRLTQAQGQNLQPTC